MLAIGSSFSDGPFKMDFWGRMLLWALEPPPKLRSSAPKNFQPVDIGAPDRVLASFLKTQEDVLAAWAAAKGLALDRLKTTSPFARQVRYSLWSSFVVTAAHQRRHLWQAGRVANALLK